MLFTRAITKKIFLFGLLAVLSVGHPFAGLAAAPTITSFSPATGPVGTLVTINGTGLTSPTAFTIGGQAAVVVSNTGSVLVAMVMPNSTTGAISLTTASGTATSGSNFTVKATPFPSTQQGAKLVGTGNTGAPAQGSSVSLSADGNTAILGGAGDNSNIGAAWVYTRSGGTWTQQGSKLVGTGNTGAANQGASVSLSADGNTAIVGGSGDNNGVGATWVYTRSGSTWTQQGSKLVGTGNTGASNQGTSVSLSADGNTAMVGGAADNSNIGAAWVYTRSGSTWTQQGSKLVGTGNTGAATQGIYVSLSADGNTAMVGGANDNSNIGAAWVYTRSGSTWTQQGLKLVGTGNTGAANQGTSVNLSADGNTAMVGGSNDNSSVGATWVYTRSGSTWTQQSKLVGTGNTGASNQGVSVSLSADGNTAMVGGHGDNSAQGAAWVYTRSGSTWTQQGSKLVGTGNTGAAYQGYSVSVSADGNTAMVGGFADNSYVGAAWVYTGPVTPTTPATYVTFASTTGTSTSTSWTNGNGTARAVFVSVGTSGSPVPVNATTYTAGTAFGSGTQIGSTGWYCVYNGTGTTVNITGLTAGADYRVMTIEYNGAPGYEQYLTTVGVGTDNPATVSTLGTTQGVTKYGQLTTASTNFIDQYGRIGSVPKLNQYSQLIPSPCGSALTITHTAGTIAPVTTTISYGTVSTNLSGSYKCWITQNLGASVPAASATDATAAAAGWYWQFNRMQGYTATPTPTWTITGITETSDWLAANDPCTLSLGTGWRTPTKTEWTAVNANGAWTSYTNTYASVLKVHPAGNLSFSNGALFNLGTYGSYWSSTQNSSTNGWYLLFYSSSSAMSNAGKANGFSLRCLRD